MQVKIPSEAVGAKIVEWYSCLVSRSYDQAMLLRDETKTMIRQMEKNDKILAYFSLVDYRHSMLMNSYDKNTLDEELLGEHDEITQIDNMLKYFYYFISGQSEYVHERYRSAVKLFERAGRLLEHVNDEAEEAEFYQYTGYVYYRLNQYLIASSYMEKASVIYQRLQYTEPYLNCQIILAAIYQELHNPDKGEVLLKEALEKARGKGKLSAVIIRVLGLNKLSVKDYLSAELYFKEALTYEEHKDALIGAKTSYNLSNALFNQGKKDEALRYFQIAEAEMTYYQNKEYLARCLATKGLHIKNDYQLVDKAIERLTKLGLDFEIAEVAEDASGYAEKEGNDSLALKYMKVAHRARLYQNAIGEDSK
ncbi:aspartate phosphatase [Alkalihalobacillus sp. LMS6]|uniref:response regulator aspartate phosphatase n=2 Tax=Bacillaceae TaxID=186817 RepID=UPI0020D01CB9|nr:tetratricopeptide repeat protein [Alkalihalobacillus sp. LMS6]UTR07126.1 aspartate phosphatase [Alkalihalobacillus sp. LMS6]